MATPTREFLMSPLQFVAVAAVATWIGGCASAPVPEKFQQDYASARASLEAGDYETALMRYKVLLPTLGDDRIGVAVRLDYASALLRAGLPDRAMTVAREIEIIDVDPSLSLHASLIAAIAEHEAVERMVAQGAPYEEAQSRARAAFRSLEHVVRHDTQFDPEAVLIERMRRLRETLAGLEISQLRAELEANTTAAAAARAAYVLREFGDTDAVDNARALLLHHSQVKEGSGAAVPLRSIGAE